MGSDELTDFLMANSVLPQNFAREEIAALAAQLNVEEYPAGETLMREGTPACSLMLLISGEVRRMLGDVELNLLHAGEFWQKHVHRCGSHYANVVATEPVVVGSVDRALRITGGSGAGGLAEIQAIFFKHLYTGGARKGGMVLSIIAATSAS